MTRIIDISHHQGKINWDEFAKEADLLIIRVQDGSTTIDREYKTYVAEAKKRGIPFGHYAFTRFVSVEDAKKEAQDFYARGDKSALFWVADVEMQTTDDMTAATQAYIDELQRLGAKKIGGYFAHHGYKPWGLDKVKGLDFKWFPRYGVNDGKQHTKPAYPCELWQYTSVGKVAGVKGFVDLNVLVGENPIEWFTGEPKGGNGVIRYIYTGGYAGQALLDVHNYLFKTGHNFNCKRGADGSIIFLIGPFDTGMSNYKDCKAFLDKAGHVNKLYTPEQAAKFK